VDIFESLLVLDSDTKEFKELVTKSLVIFCDNCPKLTPDNDCTKYSLLFKREQALLQWSSAKIAVSLKKKKKKAVWKATDLAMQKILLLLGLDFQVRPVENKALKSK